MRADRAPAGGRRRLLASLALLLLFGAACATRSVRRFPPATAEEGARALEAWRRALGRADSLGAANLLYDAAITQGPARLTGTLAVRVRGGRVEASLSGPFGSPIARYEEGALRGEKLEPVRIDPAEFRALLAGAWPGEAPVVGGAEGDEALLRWEGEDAAQGVLDLAAARLVSLSVVRPEGELTARYAGPCDPWPEKIEVAEKRTGSRLRLKLIAREAAR